jgi:hypothetical protein
MNTSYGREHLRSRLLRNKRIFGSGSCLTVMEAWPAGRPVP